MSNKQNKESSMDEILHHLQQAIIAGDPDRARELAKQALVAGVAPLTVIEQALTPGMQVVGNQFECGESFIPDLMMAAKAMQEAMAVLEPALIERQEQRQLAGVVVIGTVAGDIHEIGKNLVATMLSASGLQVHDLGVDVPASRFVERVQETGADVIGLSALLTTTMRNQQAVIEALQHAGLRQRVKVIIGGAPASPEWAQTIGADAYAENANEAVGVVKNLLGVK
ncbi:MAG: corrinoid protein [Anaerolineae bacterium]|nr:corrinoid protein [Anaerolineae bacterium]